ncbi:MAG: FAD-binding oxidoreductase, partial [Acidimicrobiia bacterium]
MADLAEALTKIVGVDHTYVGDAISDDYAHDEALTATPQVPVAVVQPSTTAEVAAVLRLADDLGVPVTARGSGTGLSGACTPASGGLVVSFGRMNAILEIDEENHVAVVQPGVTLAELDTALAPHQLVYPVFPGEYSASLGGNVATNAGGMRAVKYGVTRHHVIGLEAVLASGETIRTGGKLVKTSTGYDLTQLIIGSEGTLALVTEATLKLYPRAEFQATVLAPFPSVEAVTAAVPRVVASGVGPLILEYIDMLTMSAMTTHFGFDLGIPSEVKETALAYLVVMMEQHDAERLDADVLRLAEHLADLGAIDVYVLPPQAAGALIDGREKAFWLA